MGHQLAVLLILWMLYYSIVAVTSQESFSVVDYGAVGDGNTDDANAFSKAWSDTCNSKSDAPSMIIPQGKTFLVKPLTFKGPCKANIVNIKIDGKIIAPNLPATWDGFNPGQWLVFHGINGFNISGPGIIDGQGSNWWDQSCKKNPKQGCTTLAPTALFFEHCKTLHLNNMHVINSPQTHITFLGCNDVNVNYIVIRAPGDSPNTDGIHIHSSQSVNIFNSDIENGDDCISIGDFTSDILIKFSYCGFGHGISIGSLGKGPKGGTEAQVENIFVTLANFKRSTNGARIKTWQGGSGYARNITFQGLNFTDVQNPIIIDQYYCGHKGGCAPQPTAVKISDVTYSEIRGTSTTQVAVNFNCSQSVPCTGILVDNVQLVPAISGKKLISSCNNAHGRSEGVDDPPCCLQS